MRKKVDSRVRIVIENGVKLRNRTMFVIVGDRGRDQVVNLHYMLSKSSVKARPSVLWCYKKELGFTSHQKKRMKQIKNDIKRGIRDANQDDPFELFLSSTNIRYTYYKDSHTVLGNTFGMLVLQDFEALTPNLLARTIETVEGGGIIVALVKTMSSLKQLYSMSMDVHSRFRTESHQDVVGRFNERFILSLASCQQCLVVDDELNILPISSHMKSIKPVALSSLGDDEDGTDVYSTPNEKELKTLKISMQDTPPIGALLDKAKTLDQAKGILAFVDAISEKTLRSTVSLTAARGRGKSSALGLAVAAAVAYGYANIFVTAPSSENLKTFFEMVFVGFDALEYKEHMDYEAIESTNPEFGAGTIVRVNIFREHRQTIQYIHPADSARLAQAELLVIDEAAAIPLPMVKNLLGPYLVFLSSTINGYEGTGRSLSLKLLKQLREQSVGGQASAHGRALREITLEEPIRYASGDKVESWLNELLCLDCTGNSAKLIGGIPHPSKCDLYYVNRDTLFSYHKASEAFLHRIMSLFVSSHYKNTPNDLQLLSDAPAHHIFALLGPIDPENETSLPDVLCVIQVCLEGEISKESVKQSLARGIRKAGDLIPWTISQQYQDYDFPKLSGARIVRIATHPDAQRMGYGTRALELLKMYYDGQYASLSEDETPARDVTNLKSANSNETESLHDEVIAPRKNLPPLLESLTDRTPESLQYLGTSFGVTQTLFDFWGKSGFKSVYMRQTASDLTGEYTCIMLKSLEGPSMDSISSRDWLDGFASDFKRRFMILLAYGFRSFSASLGLSIVDLDPRVLSSGKSNDDEISGTDADSSSSYSWTQLQEYFTSFDIDRLDAYSRNLVDYHMILDLLPPLVRLLFSRKIPVSISYSQAAIFLAVGLQFKSISDVEKELGLMSNQVLAAFNKAVRKISNHIKKLREEEVRKTIPEVQQLQLKPVKSSLSSELNAAAKEVEEQMRNQQQELLRGMNLEQFEISGNDKDWESAVGENADAPSTISIKSDKDRSKKRKHDKQSIKNSSPKNHKGQEGKHGKKKKKPGN